MIGVLSMNKFLIITNIVKDIDSSLSKKVEEKIKRAGKSVSRVHFDAAWVLRDDDGQKYMIDPETECALVVGGDGTMLRAEHELIGWGIPMVGINMGTVGYLADIDSTMWEVAIDELINGHPVEEERMMLSGVLIRGEQIICRELALNDIFLSRKSGIHVISVSLEIDGQHVKTYNADGMIVSTPTGSTAYNLSAGGPIAVPSSQLMLVTPISPHVLINRSLVVGRDSTVSLSFMDRRSTNNSVDAAVYFDGREYDIEPGDRVEIEKAQVKAKLFNMSEISFLENLSRKMNEGQYRL